MEINGFEIKQLPNGYVDCLSWRGTVINTLDNLYDAIAWAKSNDAPKLDLAAKAELTAIEISINKGN